MIETGGVTSEPVLLNYSKSCQSTLNMQGQFDKGSHVYDRDEKKLAVMVRNVCKSYADGKQVLNNICMSVPKGTIYGLLGSSGCGKTTLLSCLVGLRKWESGDIQLFGRKSVGTPGRIVGYMPQDLSVYDLLSIQEMIQFYGQLYGLSRKEINEQCKWLIDFLKLPTEFHLIRDLSGGQRRRVSLAVALAHSPDLLILDEPTVGLDPLLRESIWKYLLEIVRTRQTTIIVTTHYIEEARFSNIIGLMRKGRLLVENSPDVILRENECELLEQAMLKLCRKDETNIQRLSKCAIDTFNLSAEGKLFQNVAPKSVQKFKKVWNTTKQLILGSWTETKSTRQGEICQYTEDEDQQRQWPSSLTQDKIPFKSNTDTSSAIGRVKAISTLLWLMYLRHPIFMTLVVFLPAIQILLTLVVLGTHPKDLPFGVVNYDMPYFDGCFQPDYTTKIVNDDDGSTSCELRHLSCSLILELSKTKTLKLIPIKSTEEAIRLVDKGDLHGYFSFNRNYSQHFQNLAVEKRFAGNETLEGSRVYMRLDMSNYLGSLFAIQDSFEAYNKFAQQLAISCQIDPREFTLPMEYKKPIFGKAGATYQDYVLPVALLAVLFEVPMIVTPIIFIYEEKQGTLGRCLVAGVRIKEVMASHFITQGVVTATQTVICYVVMYFFYNFEVKGEYWLAYIICMWGGLAGVSFGLMLAVMCREELEVLMVGIFFGPTMLMFGGAIWPLQGMNAAAQTFARCLPAIIAESFRSVVYRGLGVSHDYVWPGLVVNISWVCVCWLLAVAFYRGRGN